MLKEADDYFLTNSIKQKLIEKTRVFSSPETDDKIHYIKWTKDFNFDLCIFYIGTNDLSSNKPNA